ncbi:MAG: plasma-membrane proton-efflux P-type ATPase [Patescibacteria group bacterium]|nr:plasma-membrane proton-efflux P-type ATPase [Patescibacteria group bacterium]
MLGLTSEQAKNNLKTYGFNEITEKKKGVWRRFFEWFFSPINLMLIAAAVFSFLLMKMFDGWFILALAALNFGISFWQEHKADTAIEELNKKLSVTTKTLRDNSWQWIESRYLVPDDVIELSVGDVVPADAKILTATNLSLNEAALTGESLPKTKDVNEGVFSGSFVMTGIAQCQITATGSKTSFGKTLSLVEKSEKRSDLEKNIISITKFLTAISIVAIIILTAYFIIKNIALTDILRLDLSLLIAAIPVSLPTVMTVVISIGILELSKKNVIIRRLAALEDLANVNLLLTDKTGTLTENKIKVEKIIGYKPFAEEDVIKFAALASQEKDRSAIDGAIKNKAEDYGKFENTNILSFTPADSIRKRNTATVKINGDFYTISSGAVQVIEKLLKDEDGLRDTVRQDIERETMNGYRIIAIAVKKDQEEKNMDLAGLIMLGDPLMPDIKEIIDFMRQRGIETKMLTGDNYEITKRISADLGFPGSVIKKEDIFNISKPQFDKASAFSEIFPEDKLNLVEFAKKNYIVAVTGDGVNDLPAIKVADVGIAVSNAVSALKGAADIALLAHGLSVIKDAIIEARRIFERLYRYSLYRISESFRLIITVLVLGGIFGTYPLSPLQLILITFLNDLPMISLAYDKVEYSVQPTKINVKERSMLSLMFGFSGILNSLILFFILKLLNFPLGIIETMFFLKLTVSGHMLIYVAHTPKRWYKYFPSWQVISATIATQLVASGIAYIGLGMTPISLSLIAVVWVWSFIWMQFSELMKIIQQDFFPFKA